MQPRALVTLTAVSLLGLTSVFCTSISLERSSDQYSTHLSENSHDIAHRLRNFVNRNHSSRMQNQQAAQKHNEINDKWNDDLIYKTQKGYKGEVLHSEQLAQSVESNLHGSVSKSIKIETKPPVDVVFRLNFDKDCVGMKSFIPNANVVNKNRNSRSINSLFKNRYIVQDEIPFLDIEFGLDAENEEEDSQYYEEVDELLRLREEEKIHGQPKNEESRGDIPVIDEDGSEASRILDIPLRGDIGAANALALKGPSQVIETTVNPSSVRTRSSSMSLDDVLLTNANRAYNNLHKSLQKRDVTNFSQKHRSAWDNDQRNNVSFLKNGELERYKENQKKNTKVVKKNRNNKHRSSDQNLGQKIRMEANQRNMHHSIEMNNKLLEQKLREYISRNTPIDIRLNKFVNNANHDKDYKNGNLRKPHSENSRKVGHITDYMTHLNQRKSSNQNNIYINEELNALQQHNYRRNQSSIHIPSGHSNIKPKWNRTYGILEISSSDYNDKRVSKIPNQPVRYHESRLPDRRYNNHETNYSYDPDKFLHQHANKHSSTNHNNKQSNNNSDLRHSYDSRTPHHSSSNNRPILNRYNFDNRNYQLSSDKTNNAVIHGHEVDDYIQRNTPIDIRLPSENGHDGPYGTRTDRVRSESNNNYLNEKTMEVKHAVKENLRKPSYSQNERSRQRNHKNTATPENNPEYYSDKSFDQKPSYQEYRRPETSYIENYEHYRYKPVEATIHIIPRNHRSQSKRDVEYARIDPHHKGLSVNYFPVPATKKPPVESPSLCIWAVIKCCSNNSRRKNCFEAHGCPEISWDPNPCRKSVRDAARDEIRQFYANNEDYYYK